MGRARLGLMLLVTAWAFASLCARSLLAAEPLRVLVLSGGATDLALVERLRGQLSDLEITIDLAAVGQPVPHPSVDLALRLAEKRGAKVAVWFEQPDPTEDHLIVHVAELRTRRSMARELGEGGAGSGVASSTREAAALVVREALRAVIAGVEIGEEPVRESRAATASPPASAPAAARKPRQAPGLRGAAALGWGAAFDGEAPLGHQGAMARGGARLGSVEASIVLELTLPTHLESQYGAFELARHALVLRGLRAFRLSPSVELGLGVRAGAVGYHRRTTRATPSVDPSRARLTPGFLIGAESELAFSPRRGPWAVIANGGLDVLPEVTRVGYDGAGGRDVIAEPAQLQPRLCLGLRWLGR